MEPTLKTSSKRSPLLVRPKYWFLLFGAVAVTLLTGFGSLILANENSSRDALTDRFLNRSELSANFVENYVDYQMEQQVRQAEQFLSTEAVTVNQFDRVVTSFGFRTAGLLDSDGNVIRVWPPNRELVGQNAAEAFPYLQDAVNGKGSVSGVIASGVTNEPVTSIAVPFKTSSGQRVFVGGLSPNDPPLGEYLKFAVPVKDGFGFLLDGNHEVLASSTNGMLLTPKLKNLPNGISEIKYGNETVIAAVTEVPEYGWHVVLTAPKDSLHAPVSGRQWSSWILLAAFFVTIVTVGVLLVALNRARVHAVEIARTDTLTGVANRRAMLEALQSAAALSARYQTPFSALMIDVDRFKNVNDTYGHDTGDKVIKDVVAAIRKSVRDEDFVSRWGGEEFLVLLQHTELDRALIAAERIRTAVADLTFDVFPEPVTVSIGVGVLEGRDTEKMIRDADTALYAAKHHGRNRVEYLLT